MGSGKLKTAHIRFLKRYREKEVKRITSVLEDDKEDDFVEDGNNKVAHCRMLVNNSKKEDTDKLMEEYGDVRVQY